MTRIGRALTNERMTRERCRLKIDKERGAALVEMALVFPLLAMLLLGMASSAIAYGQKSAITNATREASRFGATTVVDGDLSGWLAEVALVAEGASTGDLDTLQANHFVCVAYVYPDGVLMHDLTYSLRVDQLGPIESFEPCFDDGRPDSERRVQVLISRPATIETGFLSSQVTLTSKAISVFERSLP